MFIGSIWAYRDEHGFRPLVNAQKIQHLEAYDVSSMLSQRPCLFFILSLVAYSYTAPIAKAPECPNYTHHSRDHHDTKLSTGKYRLPYQRPVERCRTFRSPEVEQTIERIKRKIADPDLSRLFENAYPNTLDTAVRWTGFARDVVANKTTDEDLAFIITGDMYAGIALLAKHR